jgi:UDP-glucuronate 4-epimerase
MVATSSAADSMKVVVTGAAGFIGSHLSEELLRLGHVVQGVDSFTDFYDPGLKRRNIKGIVGQPGFSLEEVDLRFCDLEKLFSDVQIVFHLAGQSGVRSSWAERFPVYTEQNINATQRVLEASLRSGVNRVVYASSSSVYGNAAEYPVKESDPVNPFSPYGATKLAGEHLCRIYAANFGLPTVCLRYFTVYGPRQRPDMAIQRLIERGVDGKPFVIFGDGLQRRDFTYVSDAVTATVLAGTTQSVGPGTVANVSGGADVTLLSVIELVEAAIGKPIQVVRRSDEVGDVERTGGASDVAAELFGWSPQVEISTGIGRQVAYHLEGIVECDRVADNGR